VKHIDVDLGVLDDASGQPPGDQLLGLARQQTRDPEPADQRQRHVAVLVDYKLAAKLVLLEDDDA